MKVKVRGWKKKKKSNFVLCVSRKTQKLFFRRSILSVLSFMKIKVFPLDTETTSGILYF